MSWTFRFVAVFESLFSNVIDMIVVRTIRCFKLNSMFKGAVYELMFIFFYPSHVQKFQKKIFLRAFCFRPNQKQDSIVSVSAIKALRAINVCNRQFFFFLGLNKLYAWFASFPIFVSSKMFVRVIVLLEKAFMVSTQHHLIKIMLLWKTFIWRSSLKVQHPNNMQIDSTKRWWACLL